MFDFSIDKQMFALYNTNTEQTFVRTNVLIKVYLYIIYNQSFWGEDRIEGEKKMRKKVSNRMLKNRIRNLCIAAVMILTGCMTFGAFLVSAHENEDETVYIYYKSIEIQQGDTLWDIAQDTMPSEYDSTAEYVQALKDMNNLSSDQIQAGMHLMIAYESTELK